MNDSPAILGREFRHFILNPYYSIYFALKQIGASQDGAPVKAFYQEAVKRYPGYLAFIPEVKNEKIYRELCLVQHAICKNLTSYLQKSNHSLGDTDIAGMFKEIEAIEKRLHTPFAFNQKEQGEPKKNSSSSLAPAGNLRVVPSAVAEARPKKESSLMKLEKDPSTLSSMTPLNFLPENDIDYLKNEPEFLELCQSRLLILHNPAIEEKIFVKLKEVANDLKKESHLEPVKEKIFTRGVEHSYLIEIRLSDFDFNQRKEIEAVFVALVLRHALLKDTAVSPEVCERQRHEFSQRVQENYRDFWSGPFNPEENTRLFRFERAIDKAKELINGNRNKGLFLSSAALLEWGKEGHRKYISTQVDSDVATQMRVRMIESLCGVKRAKRGLSGAMAVKKEEGRQTSLPGASTNWSDKNEAPTTAELLPFSSALEVLDSSLFSDEASRLEYMRLKRESAQLYLDAIKEELLNLESLICKDPAHMPLYQKLEGRKMSLEESLNRFNTYFSQREVSSSKVESDSKEG